MERGESGGRRTERKRKAITCGLDKLTSDGGNMAIYEKKNCQVSGGQRRVALMKLVGVAWKNKKRNSVA